MERKIYAENEPADYASDFFSQKIAAYPIVETDVESTQIKHRMFWQTIWKRPHPLPSGESGSMSFPDTG